MLRGSASCLCLQTEYSSALDQFNGSKDAVYPVTNFPLEILKGSSFRAAFNDWLGNQSQVSDRLSIV